MSLTCDSKDILQDVILYSYSDYIAEDTDVVHTFSSSDEHSQNTQPTKLEKPPASKAVKIIKSDLTRLVFSDYISSNESDDTLEACFRRSVGHSFGSSSLGVLVC